MSQNRKRKFSASFKAKVALEAHKGSSTIRELCKSYELHSNQILDWKKTLTSGVESLFSSPSKSDPSPDESEKAQLYEQIGRLEMELKFLKKKLSP
jgi:transposase